MTAWPLPTVAHAKKSDQDGIKTMRYSRLHFVKIQTATNPEKASRTERFSPAGRLQASGVNRDLQGSLREWPLHQRQAIQPVRQKGCIQGSWRQRLLYPQ